ncbi:hypothetical protein ABFS82_13G112000 [Erythranthe guttata]
MASCNSIRFFLLSLIIPALFVPHECYEEGRSGSMMGRKEMVKNIRINGGKININLCRHTRNCPEGDDCYCCLIGDEDCYPTDAWCASKCH